MLAGRDLQQQQQTPWQSWAKGAEWKTETSTKCEKVMKLETSLLPACLPACATLRRTATHIKKKKKKAHCPSFISSPESTVPSMESGPARLSACLSCPSCRSVPLSPHHSLMASCSRDPDLPHTVAILMLV